MERHPFNAWKDLNKIGEVKNNYIGMKLKGKKWSRR